MIVLFVFAFVSGIITIAAPCIWPILPIVFSASASSGGKRRPLGITVGLVLSFSILTLSLSYALRLFSFDPDILRWIAVVVIGALGVVLIFPKLSAQLEGLVSRLQGRLQKPSAPMAAQSSGWWGGVVTGVALGIIWTPCAGPILATIATLASTQAVNLQVVLLTFTYTLGVGVPLFILALIGQRLFHSMRKLNKYTGRIQQVFGGVMILSAVMIGTGYDRTLQAKLLDLFPGYANFVVDLESNDTVEKQLEALQTGQVEGELGVELNQVTADPNSLPDYGPAPELGGISAWLNTANGAALTLEELRGQVVLVDFWTYTCINCIRTLPYVQAWQENYADNGLVILGVHTPEFVFERAESNVAAAITKYGLTYPVALDNDYVTWQNFSNKYWPAKYLIDANGHIRYYHFGEGNYAETEAAIQTLLAEAGTAVDVAIETADTSAYDPMQTPEIYLGTARAEHFAHEAGLRAGRKSYASVDSLADNLALHQWTVEGEWELSDEAASPIKAASLSLRYQAGDVYLVITPEAGTEDTAGGITVLLDDEPISADQAGADVVNGAVQLDTARLYHLVHSENLAEHKLTLEFADANLELFAFTFGAPEKDVN